MNICAMCKIQKPKKSFSKRIRNGKITLQFHCKECHSKYRKEHYQRNKKKYLKKAREWENKRKIERINYLLEYFKKPLY